MIPIYGKARPPADALLSSVRFLGGALILAYDNIRGILAQRPLLLKIGLSRCRTPSSLHGPAKRSRSGRLSGIFWCLSNIFVRPSSFHWLNWLVWDWDAV